MTGYTRQSTFATSDVIKAEHGNDEFNQLEAFAAQATGHRHDGTVAEGGYLPLLSDTSNTFKVEIVNGVGAKTTGSHEITAAITVGANSVINADLTVNGTITETSDAKYKTNLEQIPDALAKVSQLTGYTFDRTDIETDRKTGLLAQDVQCVLPEAVWTAENGDLSVAYGNVIGLLVEAIKELSNKVEGL